GRVRPGTVIVDYSSPSCFDRDRAMRRFAESGDILFASGGSVRPRGQSNWMMTLPPELLAMARDGGLQALMPASTAITGCVLSSLLPVSAGLPATLGEVTIQECREHWQAFAALGVEAAPLHCGTWTPTPADIMRFRTNVQAAA